MSPKTASIPLLNGSNYFNWKYRMQMELQRKDLWEVIDGGGPKPSKAQSTKYKAWMRKESQALGEIVSYVEDSQLNYTRISADPKVVWERLAEVYEVKGWAAKIRLRKQLLGIRKRDEQSMQDHLNAISDIVQRLEAINHRLTEDDIIATLFVSLPDEYEAVIVSLESLDEDKLTVKWVQDRLLAHEGHLLARKSPSTPSELNSHESAHATRTSDHEHDEHDEHAHAARTSASVRKRKDTPAWKKRLKCHACDQRGHFADECPKEKKKKPPASSSDDESSMDNDVSSSSEDEKKTMKRRIEKGKKKLEKERRKVKALEKEKEKLVKNMATGAFATYVETDDGGFVSHISDPA